LLEAEAVARATLRTMLSGLTGHVIDIRRADPFTSHAISAQVAEDMHQSEPHDAMPENAEAARDR
jgi:2-C-methyl-D-erythritol 4-phosphate cytidylyltransferase